jgi:ElaB/YqjD/DUF883 family membrane-anchored ribosome-binding protein
MENTYEGSGESVQNSADRLNDDLRSGARNVQSSASSELKNLIADVEDLVGRVGNLKDADVSRVRSKVEHALAAAKESLASGTETARRQARKVAGSADQYVRESPWQAIGIAALAGVAIGYLLSRRD